MAKLQRDITSGFSAARHTKSLTLMPRLKKDKTLLRIDAEIVWRVTDAKGDEIDEYTGYAQDISMDVASWYTAQFRADAWAAYKASKGYTETA